MEKFVIGESYRLGKFVTREGFGLEEFVVIGLWIIFLLLIVYTFLSWKKEGFEYFTDTIRKCWYLIYILGSLAFLTKDPQSFLIDWKNYLIVLIAFIVIDSLLFLNLYVSKLGGQELKSAKVQVGVTQEELESAKRKMDLIPNILISFEFPMYNLSREEYILRLESLLKQYASEENLVIDLLPFGTEEEKEQLLEGLGKSRHRAKRFLTQQNSFTSSKDNIGLYPFRISNYPYIVQVQTIEEDEQITKVDGTAITTLVVTYNLTVSENLIESGEEQ